MVTYLLTTKSDKIMTGKGHDGTSVYSRAFLEEMIMNNVYRNDDDIKVSQKDCSNDIAQMPFLHS